MKIFFYALREYDEQKYVEEFAKSIRLSMDLLQIIRQWKMLDLLRDMMPYQL